MLDLPAGFFGGNHAALIGGFHPLSQDAADCRADLNFRLVANKRIDTLDPRHIFTVARIGGLGKRIVASQWVLSLEVNASKWLSPRGRGGVEADMRGVIVVPHLKTQRELSQTA